MSEYKTYKPRATVRARQIKEDGTTVITSSGPIQAQKGDYEVRDDTGYTMVVPQADFEANYY